MGGHFPLFLLKMAWVAMVVRVALAALAGYGLLQKAAWGRWVAIVAGVLTLIHPLLGTLLAIWTFVVLLNAANAAGYEAMSEG
jgi:ABC-type glycerol-3-phosphate transport system permease component